MTLHTLNKQAKGVVQLCTSALSAADSLLLYEDGIYAVCNAENAQYFAELPADIKLYVLSEDLEARGMTDKFPATFTKITYRDFVSLSLACNKVVNWN